MKIATVLLFNQSISIAYNDYSKLEMIEKKIKTHPVEDIKAHFENKGLVFIPNFQEMNKNQFTIFL